MEFHGPREIYPLLVKKQKPLQSRFSQNQFSQMPFWIPGVGFRATIIDFWETDNEERLLLKKLELRRFLYHKAVLDDIMTPHGKTEKGEQIEVDPSSKQIM